LKERDSLSMIHSWFMTLAHSPLGHAMQTSKWAFAAVEMVHLVALALLGGSVLVIDLRLLGLLFRGVQARALGCDLGRVLLASLAVMVASGVALVSEEAGKCYASPAFRWKMALLAAAVTFYFTLHRRALERTGTGAPDLWCRAAGAVSLMLWLGVGVAGRAIGLL
jgi:hypothetical protein